MTAAAAALRTLLMGAPYRKMYADVHLNARSRARHNGHWDPDANWDAADTPSVRYIRVMPVLPLTRSTTLFAAGIVLGFQLGRRRASATSDSRWFERSNELLAEASLDGWFVRLSSGWEDALGWTREELMSRPFLHFVHPEDRAATIALRDRLDMAPGEVVDFENRYVTKDGGHRWLLWRARSDRERKYAVARDITERKRLEHERERLLEQVAALARTDDLTGLLNRRAWDEEVPKALARARRAEYPLALALVDFDHFKQFNDAHGHQAGDDLLAEAARSWRAALRSTDTIARYGGEEFALLLPDCPAAEVATLLERFTAATPSGQTVSVGVAYWDGVEDARALASRADEALYAAKKTGRDRVVTAMG